MEEGIDMEIVIPQKIMVSTGQVLPKTVYQYSNNKLVRTIKGDSIILP